MEKQNAILLVWSIKDHLFGRYMREDGLDVRTIYKGSESRILNVIRMLCFKWGLPQKPWFNQKIKGLEGTVILFDAMVGEEYLEWVVQNNPKARIIFFYANPIMLAKLKIAQVEAAGCEVWSYGDEQCAAYQLKQNAHFCCESMYKEAKRYTKQYQGKKEYDIVFSGKDKGRLEYLYSLMKKKYWKKFRWGLYISPDHFWQIFQKKIYRMVLPYHKLLCWQAKGKAVLEMVPSSLNIPTMRTVDAMSLRQKLITNNQRVMENDYYYPENIFIMGVDREEELENFINSPFRPIPRQVWKELSLDRWIERFVKDQPVNKDTMGNADDEERKE
ncbi:MAG: hypothetical protein IKM28_07850 [Lachnospiraceae bacterium]|nr:hypothetical protein [Lachnospiraceae bacterium]